MTYNIETWTLTNQAKNKLAVVQKWNGNQNIQLKMRYKNTAETDYGSMLITIPFDVHRFHTIPRLIQQTTIYN